MIGDNVVEDSQRVGVGAEEFGGVIGKTVDDSTPWWPSTVDRSASPNVMVILLDDTGFAHFGCYGSDIDTPNIDALASAGLRYTNFHTNAMCAPTRASLMTGRNHHTVGMRALTNFDTGYPNTRGRISKNAATLAEVLRDNGYATFATGKWHLCSATDASSAGPFDDWPLQRGFDRFYGFLQGETDQFHPELTYDNHHIESPSGRGDGYHLSEDLVDKTIDFIRESKSIRPDRPFFSYLSFGATHSPHQAPPQFLAKYRGRYDEGWDVVRQRWFERQLELGVVPEGTNLAELNPGVRPWTDLDDNERRFAARLQEAFAAFLDHTDVQIGRVTEFLESIGELENTIVVVTSDNGASQEGTPTGLIDQMKFFNGYPEDVVAAQDRLDDIGGPNSHSNIPWGWAQVGNTPLKRYKQNTFGGGVRDPLIIHWPQRISDPGALRTQFHHVSDLAPTLLDVVGLEFPSEFNGREQLPVTGTTMAYTFDDPGAKTTRSAQYFEMFGHRGIWADGWKAVTFHQMWTPFDADEWELYHVDEDYSESMNLAAEHPEKLNELVELWWAEAEAHGVLPLDDDMLSVAFRSRRPGTPHEARSYRYLPPVSRLPTETAPMINGRSWHLEADIVCAADDEGALIAWGTSNTGLVLFVQDGELVLDYNLFGSHHTVSAPAPVGTATVTVDFVRTDSGADITVTGADAAHGQVPWVLRHIGWSGMDIGCDAGSPVGLGYQAPFRFTGTFEELRIEITDELTPAEIFRRDFDRVMQEMAQQ